MTGRPGRRGRGPAMGTGYAGGTGNAGTTAAAAGATGNTRPGGVGIATYKWTTCSNQEDAGAVPGL